MRGIVTSAAGEFSALSTSIHWSDSAGFPLLGQSSAMPRAESASAATHEAPEADFMRVSATLVGVSEGTVDSSVANAPVSDVVALLADDEERRKLSTGTIAAAGYWLGRLQEQAGQRWSLPNASVDLDGEIVFEWWEAGRKLTVYIGEQEVEGIRVWGPRLDDDMAIENLTSPVRSEAAWRWLLGQDGPQDS